MVYLERGTTVNTWSVVAQIEPPFKFEHQQLLYERLKKADDSPTNGKPRKFRLSTIYMGLVEIASDKVNHDYVALTAHAARELMDKVAMYIDVPIPVEKSLKQAVNDLASEFRGFRADLDAFSGTGKLEMPEERLQAFKRFARDLIAFFDEFIASYRSVTQKARTLFTKTDPRASELGESLREEQSRAWVDLKRWFENVSHHGEIPNEIALDEKQRSLEIVLRGLFPEFTPVANEIDEILKKYQ